MCKSKSKLIFTIFFLLAVLGGLSFYLSRRTKSINSLSQTNKAVSQPITQPASSSPSNSIRNATIRINDKNFTIDLTTGSTTVYAAMEKLKETHQLNFSAKNYSGLGYFIDELDSQANNAGGNNKFWIYYLNGKSATAGISAYQIQPDDVIEWRYEKSTF